MTLSAHQAVRNATPSEAASSILRPEGLGHTASWGAMTWERLLALPDGYGWDVAAAITAHRATGRAVVPVAAGPKDHRPTGRPHLARVLAEVVRTLGEKAPAWSE